MSAGELRERVRFERRAEGANDGAGNIEQAWQFLCEVWGRMRPRLVGGSAAEAVLAGRQAGRSPWTIRVRYSSDTVAILPSDRAVRVATGDVFNVQSVLNLDEQQKYIDMDAELGGRDMSFSGFDKLQGKLGEMAQMPQGTIADQLNEQADKLVADMKAAAPKRTGRLQESIRKEPGTDGRSVLVKAGGPLTTKPARSGKGSYDYALGTEFGTSKEAAEPFFYNTYRADKKAVVAAIGFRFRSRLQKFEA